PAPRGHRSSFRSLLSIAGHRSVVPVAGGHSVVPVAVRPLQLRLRRQPPQRRPCRRSFVPVACRRSDLVMEMDSPFTEAEDPHVFTRVAYVGTSLCLEMQAPG
ncbi:unnamed protein product, partial [Urochloa humidicola]